MGDFCLLTAVGVAFDFLFQSTFYIACVALGGRMDKKGGLLCCVRCIRWRKAKPVTPVELDNLPTPQLAIEAPEKKEKKEEKPKGSIDELLHRNV